MARLSKSKIHSFTIFEDTGIPTPDAETVPHKPDGKDRAVVRCVSKQSNRGTTIVEDVVEEKDQVLDSTSAAALLDNDVDADDERRESADTQTSLSSVADSVIHTTIGDALPMHQPYTAPLIRPSFRRPQSVQRMQMTSPTPSRTFSPRHSILSKPRSRGGTPRSGRGIDAKGSPRQKRWVGQESGEEGEGEAPTKQDPLVLLHVVLLPIELPWSESVMRSLLPQATLDDLRLLRSKISANVLQRGVLIPHPGDDYSLLEEHLLEALALQQPRITACGHFIRPHHHHPISPSLPNPSETDEDADDDSAHGSSISSLSSRSQICPTCQHPIDLGPGVGRKKWEIKAFAANGLLRAAAWAAAWMEMERVDVEILPFIADDLRGELDEAQRREDEGRREREVEEERIMEVVDERIGRVREEMEANEPDCAATMAEERDLRASTEEPSIRTRTDDLPQVYRPSQVPVSILLKNYLYLLAQDRKNVAIFCFATLIALLLATKTSTPRVPAAAEYVLGDHCAACPSVPDLVVPIPSEGVQGFDGGDEGASVDLLQEALGPDNEAVEMLQGGA